MIIGNLDCGSGSLSNFPFQTNTGPEMAQIFGRLTIEGNREVIYPRASQALHRKETVWVTATSAIGGSAAGTPAATQYLLQQLTELASNRDLQPVYIQWGSGGGVIDLDPQDGWYILEGVKPDEEFQWSPVIPVEITVTKVNYTGQVGDIYYGGILPSTYTSKPGSPFVAFPVGSTVYTPSSSRASGEGTISLTPAYTNPTWFTLSSTIANWSKGGCHVYDTNAPIGTNPVLTNGSFINTNWVEVNSLDHRFVGDVVITNGLHLYAFLSGASPGIFLYLWNTALSSAAWQNWSNFFYQDNLSNTGTVRQISLLRISPEEIIIRVLESTSVGAMAEIIFRLQRGEYICPVYFRPLTEDRLNANALFIQFPAALKAVYTSAAVGDVAVQGTGSASSPLPTTQYGYGAGFINSTTYPFIAGWLYQTPPGFQPWVGATDILSFADITGKPAQNSVGVYGLFAAPFGTQTTTTDKLQAEAESGTLSGGAVSQANASASGGNECKIPSGTASQVPAPNPLPQPTDGGAAAGSLNKGGYTVVQTWTDATGETTSSGDNTSVLTPTLLQNGAVGNATSTSLVLTLPGASTAGTCLVAFLGSGANSGAGVGVSYTAPANWVQATTADLSGNVHIEVWYYLNNPGSITTATFTSSNGSANTDYQISEWTNVALVSALDSAGHTTATNTTAVTPTSSDITRSQEVIIAGWEAVLTSGQNLTFFGASGYTLLAENGGANTNDHHIDIQYLINPSSGTPQNPTLACITTCTYAAGAIIALFSAPLNTVFLTTNGDKIHFAAITAPATTTNGKFYFKAAPSGINAGLAATQAVSAGSVAAFDITANPGNTNVPPTTNTTAGTPAVSLFGTAWLPPVGIYNLWFRVKVTSAAGSGNDMKFGLWDSTSGAYMSSTIWRPNQVTTSYAWYKVAAQVTPTAGHNIQYRLNNNATTGTDWFIDEAFLTPAYSAVAAAPVGYFPQDNWYAFMFDRTTQLIIG